MDRRPLVELDNLTVDYPTRRGPVRAVDGISLTVERGSVLGIVGESGSGKSTVGYALMGLTQASNAAVAGTLRFQDTDLLALPARDWRRLRGARMSMVFQDAMSTLNPVMRVGDQIAEVFRWHCPDMPGRERSARALDLLERVGIQEAGRRMKAYPHELSGGMRQRAVIAAAIALEPALIIADEPTTALDVTVQAQILALLRDLIREKQTALIFISHDLGVVSDVCERVAVMQDGRIVEHGPTAAILQAPTHPYTRRLLDARPRFGRGHAAAAQPGGSATSGKPLLEIRDLTVEFPLPAGPFEKPRRIRAVDGVTFTLHEGEAFGLVGESGSGKSTIGRVVARLLTPTSGTLAFAGEDWLALRGAALDRRRRAVQMVFQSPYASLDPRWRIVNILGEPLRSYRVLLDRAGIHRRAAELMETVGLDPAWLERYPHQFSGGQRQRIAIARALALEPRLLIADEPVSALDVSSQDQILKLLRTIRAETGLAMLFISHDLSVIDHLCETVAVLEKGKLVDIGSTRDVFRHSKNRYTRALIDAVPGRDAAPGRPSDVGPPAQAHPEASPALSGSP